MPATSAVTCATCRRAIDARALYCGLCGRRSRVRRDSRSGAILGNTYRIEGKLAEGGFGAVYRVTHLPSGLELALKLLHADFASDPEVAARFRRESRTLANLRNPHTVTTFERGELRDGTMFIAMELLRGESLLERFLMRGRLPWQDVLKILRAVCSSLSEAHGRGIIHRDLKPANIHLGDQDFVKVLDFGVAKVESGRGAEADDEITVAGQAIGTLDYMAPEQLLGAGYSPRSDIYALGVVGFEMICGRRPFSDATTPAHLVTAMLTESVPLPSTMTALPDNVERLLLRCLERDATHRFENVAELARAIDRAIAPEQPEPAPRIASFHTVPKPALELPRGESLPSRRHLWIYVLGVLLGTVGAALVCVVSS